MLDASQVQAWVLFVVIVVALFAFVGWIGDSIEPGPRDCGGGW